ncbi:helix-turn-helix transcriptional regulator [Streptomyces sp. NPDC052225]|uniref:helix-turn-helix domain-containing protein n=1 Tax=Streptomyces sp. NPDC052225 TaxID=3154949 RepID=UPI00341E4A70
MTTSMETNLAWRYCGNQIKMWREQAGVTREALVKETGYGHEYVKSMETGRRKPTMRLLQTADQMCGAGGKLIAAQEFLKPEAHPQRAQEFMALEKDAIAISSYEPLLIPGLLQTEEYARALIGESIPLLDDETVEERVASRLKRQRMLTERQTVMFSYVLYEASLRTVVGSGEDMKRQLQQILDFAKLRNVTIKVLPYGRVSGVALNGGITLLETTDHEHYAYVEAPKTSALYADGGKASELALAHDMIRMHALSPEESAEFIRKVAEEL